MPEYFRPTSLPDAVAFLGSAPAGVRALAGGTDLYPGAGAALSGAILDLSGLSDLCGITSGPDGLRIGAATTWTDIAEAALPPGLRALQQAALQVGGRQIQNAGTIGGNLCNASPAADGVPPLLAVDAEVELASPRGIRRLPIGAFLTGPRRTARAPDELLVAIHIPAESTTGQSAFLKLGARAYLVISIAMVAVRIRSQNGRAVDVALAVGACSAVATRLTKAEASLVGLPLAELAGSLRAQDVRASLSPIDDIRATGAYRAEAAVELLRRALAEAAGRCEAFQ